MAKKCSKNCSYCCPRCGTHASYGAGEHYCLPKIKARKKRITKKDLNALQDAIDFISSNSDGATNRKPFEDTMRRIAKVWKILSTNPPTVE